MNRIKGMNALITGATSGIGEATAYKLAEYGVNLILVARREEILRNIKNDIEKKYKVEVYTLGLDVSNLSEVRNKISNLPEKWKDIDILINNAGLAKGLDKLYENKLEDISTVIDTNVKGLLYVTNMVVPNMVKRGKYATIINLGSVAGDAAYAGGAVYCATKAAIKTLSDGLRIDLIDTKIKVTDIKPGLVETNFSKVRFNGDIDRAEKVYKGIEPLTASNIADTIVYIANLPENVHITELAITCNNQADGLHICRINN